MAHVESSNNTARKRVVLRDSKQSSFFSTQNKNQDVDDGLSPLLEGRPFGLRVDFNEFPAGT